MASRRARGGAVGIGRVALRTRLDPLRPLPGRRAHERTRLRDRPRLLEDVARTFAEHGTNIVEYGGHVADQMARNWYTAEVGDVKELRALLQALRNIDAVFDAYRVTPGG